MDNKEIQNLIRFVSKSGIAEVKVKKKDFEISIKNVVESKAVIPQQVIAQPAVAPAAPVAAPTPAPAAKKETQVEDDSKYVTIKSPMIGTFYRRPSPDKDLFVNVGDSITETSVVCIIEAMKLFNEIEAEVSGKIVKILVDDSTPVEYDQPLFLVDPTA